MRDRRSILPAAELDELLSRPLTAAEERFLETRERILMRRNPRKIIDATMKRYLFAITLAVAIPPHAKAQQAALPSPPSLVGFGVVTGGCGKWISTPQNSAVDIGYTSWLVGYISGLNTVAVIDGKGDALDGYDGNSLTPCAKNWCRAHPLNQVSSAAVALMSELNNRLQRK
jgi:hypothetical protein